MTNHDEIRENLPAYALGGLEFVVYHRCLLLAAMITMAMDLH